MDGRRVVITGMGPVSSIGIGVGEFERALRAGRSGISEISSFDASGFPHRRAGEVPDFRPERYLRTLAVERWGRSSLFAAVAARLAVQDSGIDPARLAAARAGSCVGTTTGESRVIEAITSRWAVGGLGAVPAGLAEQVPGSRLAIAVNRELGLTGEATTIATACAAGNYALGYAYDQVESGAAEFMIAGSAESMSRWVHGGFLRLGVLAKDTCSPFDRDRTGMLHGEGGAALFLEPLESAVARGARIYAEVLGYAINCDAGHMVAPNGDRIAECMRQAHHNAGIEAADVDYICAHGTGTPSNDVTEFRAVRAVFGGSPPPISSIKSMIGHALGAASGFGAIASALAISGGFLPPTVTHQNPDPEMAGIDPVPGRAREASVRVVQNDGFAFGGNNAITILGRAA